MRHWKSFATTGALAAALLLALGLASGPARAASSVDVTYDLSDSTLNWESIFGAIFPVSNDFAVNGAVAGDMTIRYASDSSSNMPIEHGTATLLSFTLTAKSLSVGAFISDFGNTITGPNAPYLTGTLRWKLTTSAVGNLASTGALTVLNANMRMTGTAKCPISGFTGYYLCSFYWGIPYDRTFYPDVSRTGAIRVAGSAGPAGGAQSTRHTLSGTASAVAWKPGGALYALGTPDFVTGNDYGGAKLVGREVLREAEGHEPKVIPEPGTLLLLGSGAAGLGLLGRSRRRARRG